MPHTLLPAPLPTQKGSGRTHEGPVLRVRVQAGADFRAREHQWEQEAEAIVEGASAILIDSIGVKLKLESAKVWQRTGGTLDGTLVALRAQDNAKESDLVVGFIDAPTELENRFSALQLSNPLERHIVMRSYSRHTELGAIEDKVAGLPETTIDELVLERSRHKQAAVLAHAVWRTLGHHGSEGAGAEFASDEYVLADRRLPAENRQAHVRAAELLSGKINAKKVEEAREDFRSLSVSSEFLAALDKLHKKLVNAQSVVHVELRPKDRKRLADTESLLDAGKAMEAWEELEPLIDLYPEDQRILVLACRCAAARRASDARLRCESASKKVPNDGEVWLRLGEALIAESPDKALQSLQQANLLLDPSAEIRSDLAGAFQALRQPSFAIEAQEEADQDPKLLEWAKKMRVRYGASVGVERQEEGQYLRLLHDAIKEVYAKRYSQAEEMRDQLRGRFPRSIGADLVNCEIALRRVQLKEIHGACSPVWKRHPANSWARYLAGIGAKKNKNAKLAVDLWREAIKSDPDLEPAYKALAKSLPKGTEKSELQRQYRERFGKKL